MRALIFLVAVTMLACSRPQAPEPAKTAPDTAQASTDLTALPPALRGVQLSAAGLGPLRIGMKVEDVETLLGPLPPDEVSESDECRSHALVSSGDDVLTLMTQDRRASRISVYGDMDIATVEGIRVGSTGDDVRRVYPGASRASAPYAAPPSYDLYVWRDAQNTSGLRFELDDHDKVVAIHAGSSAIKYIEGCL